MEPHDPGRDGGLSQPIDCPVMSTPRFDEIGYWSEIKLEIVRKYAQAYSAIMVKRPEIRQHLYIDAFSGAGEHISRQSGKFVLGSPLNALHVDPPFSAYHFIDLDGDKAAYLRERVGPDPRVFVHEGDCNGVLLNDVFPLARWADYHRALCLLDPYGINLDWRVVETAGQSRSIEILLNFMVMDMNMNVLWRDPDKVAPAQLERMDAFWGDRSWRDVLYERRPSLFPELDLEDKVKNYQAAAAYRERLREVAGFKYVPEPIPMRNTRGATVYYLFFASPNEVGGKIVGEIFDRYRNPGAS
jgi:three-Cys-motif partner protein